MSIPTCAWTRARLGVGEAEVVDRARPRIGCRPPRRNRPRRRGRPGSRPPRRRRGWRSPRPSRRSVRAPRRPVHVVPEPAARPATDWAIGELRRCAATAGATAAPVDLKGAAGRARVHDHAGSRHLREALVLGRHPQQQALTDEHARGRRSGPSSRRSARNEALDGAVHQDDRPVAGVRRRWFLGAHHRGPDERTARPVGSTIRSAIMMVTVLLSCPAPDQIGGDGRPCMAAHTRDGVSGMSACRMPYGLSASTTALTTAGGEPTVADSPRPWRRSGGGATA